MSNAPAIFNFESHNIRTIETDGEPYFVASDVCESLLLANTSQALSRLDDDEKGVILNDTLGGAQKMAVVNESGLYSLIISSRKPVAKRFKKWVTNEVLPTIRKTGSYAVPVSPELQLAQAVLLAQNIISEQKLQIEQKDKVIAEIQPKAEIADRINNADGLFKFRAVAKMLSVKEPVLRDWLLSHGWMYYLSHTMTAKATHQNLGYLKEKCSLVKNVYTRTEVAVSEMYFTSKGVCKLAKAFGKEIQFEIPMDMAA